jgi:hypothetical protein
MSAFGGKADIIQKKADIKKCLLLTQSGHSLAPHIGGVKSTQLGARQNDAARSGSEMFSLGLVLRLRRGLSARQSGGEFDHQRTFRCCPPARVRARKYAVRRHLITTIFLMEPKVWRERYVKLHIV